jgi:hypothetical protein
MKKRRAYMALLALAAAPLAFADEPAWRHDFGLRVGGVGGPVPLAASLSAFYEVGPGLNWALRPSLEITKGAEWAMSGDMVDVGRVGAAVDFVYYASPKMPAGTGFFLTTGIGWHRFDFRYRMERDAQGNYIGDDWQRDTQGAASLSAGAGYQFGRNFGVEMKYGMSGQGSGVPYGIGRSWLTTSMNLRFPAPGQRKVGGRAKNAAGKAEADESAPHRHQVGLAMGPAGGFSGAYSVFYEGRVKGHWAFRPTVQFAAAHGLRPVGFPLEALADRGGLSMDCIYYASKRGRDGTGLYLLAGLGAHGTALKSCEAWRGAPADGYGEDCDYVEHFSVAPALSVGAGYYFKRYFGVEYRHTFSALDSPFPSGTGKNWWQLALIVRFPAHGGAKGE